jgi:hypothetical protein
MYLRRPKTNLPQRPIRASAETLEVGINKSATERLSPNQQWHAHAGPLVGCTAVGAIATLSNNAALVHLQHYRSPEREEGYAKFTETMQRWQQETGIVSMAVGVLSPRNKTAQPTPTGPWVKPFADTVLQQLLASAQQVHENVSFAHDTYLLGRFGSRVGDRYPGMDVIVPAVGGVAISICLR